MMTDIPEKEWKRHFEKENGTLCFSDRTRKQIYDLAYERGHSYGYNEVSDLYYDLAQLAYSVAING